MSRRSPRGDDCAPAMFPFLAVLLCTIGALVLILVVSVVHSHASAKREMDNEIQDRVEQAQERSDYLKTISAELAARREKVKLEIDRRRKELANVEDHILRLKSQMDQLRAQVEGIESAGARDQMASEERSKKIDSLKEQLDAKKREIAEEIEKSKTRKLAFSIIPYDGPNGTSRRPVYLECRAEGVIIQPEGICIGLEDLRPPYGPGNPIDAALRVLRSAYQSRDATFGLTIPPYPLLVVRPDGIHTYAMARAAMSGWDDQFGYELIDAKMDLVFPPGVPNLKEELLSTIDVARKRQQSLVATLSRHQLREREMDDIDFDSLAPDSYRESQAKLTSQSASNSVANDWKMIEEMGDARFTSTGTSGSSGSNGSVAHSPASTSGKKGTEFSQSPPSAPNGSFIGTTSSLGTNGSSNPNLPSTTLASTGNQTFNNASASNSGGRDTPSNADDSMLYGDKEGTGSSSSSTGPVGSGSSTANGQTMPPSRANAFSSGNAAGNSTQSPSAADAPTTTDSEAMAKAIREMQDKQQPTDTASATYRPKTKPSTDEASKPIASKQGKGWAMPGKDPKATPVSRPIRIVALNDRWLVRKEGSETQFDAEIDLALGPQHASTTLEKTIRNRVDSWGLSLPGGYWCPSVTVEHASDADQSVLRLQRLLDGSGVEIRTVPLQAPQPKPIPSSKIPPKR